eukprot:2999383-Rhodomonas_salina.2
MQGGEGETETETETPAVQRETPAVQTQRPGVAVLSADDISYVLYLRALYAMSGTDIAYGGARISAQLAIVAGEGRGRGGEGERREGERREGEGRVHTRVKQGPQIL